jgi:chorismate dehydratase
MRRIGAVGYLNSKPLVFGLESARVSFDVRFDVPSRCAALLHANEIDLGLIPSIEYLAEPDYAIVPGIAVASDGPVASVALFSNVPVDRIQRLALDTSSRTSAALLRVLCAERFDIRPTFESAAPDLETMLARYDAALLIGDPALFTDPDRLGVLKVDLGAEWRAHTGLPFVWAFWAGRSSILDAEVCDALSRVRDEGVAAISAIAGDFARGDAAITRQVEEYLRRNVDYQLGEPHEQALTRFYAGAANIGAVGDVQELRFVGREKQVSR